MNFWYYSTRIAQLVEYAIFILTMCISNTCHLFTRWSARTSRQGGWIDIVSINRMPRWTTWYALVKISAGKIGVNAVRLGPAVGGFVAVLITSFKRITFSENSGDTLH